jgi:hypothetical protein
MLGVLCAVGLLAAPASVESLEIRVQSGLWHVAASEAPLTTILERLSLESGMRVVYLGTPPERRVSARMQSATMTEVLDRILKGDAYVGTVDRTGDGIELLIWVAAASPGPGDSHSASPSVPLRVAGSAGVAATKERSSPVAEGERAQEARGAELPVADPTLDQGPSPNAIPVFSTGAAPAQASPFQVPGSPGPPGHPGQPGPPGGSGDPAAPNRQGSPR